MVRAFWLLFADCEQGSPTEVRQLDRPDTDGQYRDKSAVLGNLISGWGLFIRYISRLIKVAEWFTILFLFVKTRIICPFKNKRPAPTAVSFERSGIVTEFCYGLKNRILFIWRKHCLVLKKDDDALDQMIMLAGSSCFSILFLCHRYFSIRISITLA